MKQLISSLGRKVGAIRQVAILRGRNCLFSKDYLNYFLDEI